jgi:hypothetical protein
MICRVTRVAFLAVLVASGAARAAEIPVGSAAEIEKAPATCWS